MFIDFFMILVIILSIAFGFRRGFCSMLLSFAVFALSIVITLTLYNSFSQKALETKLGKNIQTSVSEGVEQYISEISNQAIDNLPFVNITQNVQENTENTENVSSDLTKKAVDVILSVVLLISSYIGAKIIIYIIRKFLHIATELPVIHGIDSMLGSVCGLLFGVVWTAVIYISTGYFSLIESIPMLKLQFDSSVLVLLISDLLM